MTDRKRDPLPAGYQFGDAGKPRLRIRFLSAFTIQPNVVPPQRRDDWNVIEGDHHDTLRYDDNGL